MNKSVVIAAVLMTTLPPASHGQQPSAGTYQITGRVVMENGSPIPDAVAVELICTGRIRKRVPPYASGDFTLVLDDDNAQAGDVTTPRDHSGGRSVPFSGMAAQSLGGEDMGRFDLSGCELRAALPGYQSTLIALGPRRRLDKSVVGQLVLRRLPDGDGPVFTSNTLAAPREARDALDEAWKQLQKPQPNHRRAVSELERAIKLYPTFAAAWHLLGVTRLAQKNLTGAREAFNESIAADSTYVEPYIELATMEAQQSRWAETATLMTRVQQLNPDIAYANYLSASAHFHLGQLAIAEKSARAVYDTPDLERYPLIYYILGAIQAHRGDFATAAVRLRQYLLTKPEPGIAASVQEMLTDWEREGRITRAP